MRILYLINGLNGGGAAFPIPGLISVMRGEGHDVRVLALMRQDGLAAATLEAAGIDYKILSQSPYNIVGCAASLISEIRSFRPDLLWTSLTRATIFGQLAGRLTGVPVVSWQHNAWLKPANLAILRRTRRLTRRWIVDSDAVANYTAETMGIARENIDIWPIFTVDPHKAPPKRQEHTGFTVGSLGRLHRNKQYNFLLEIAAYIRDHYPQIHEQLAFIVAGEGPERERLEAKRLALGLDNVHFIGFTRDSGAFLASLDAYIQPSRNEGMCIALHEAMAAALPVVATPVGQMRYSVTPDRGFLDDNGDVAGFAASIVTLARNPDMARTMGAAAREHVLENFNETRFRATGAALLARIQQDILRGKPNAASGSLQPGT